MQSKRGPSLCTTVSRPISLRSTYISVNCLMLVNCVSYKGKQQWVQERFASLQLTYLCHRRRICHLIMSFVLTYLFNYRHYSFVTEITHSLTCDCEYTYAFFRSDFVFCNEITDDVLKKQKKVFTFHHVNFTESVPGKTTQHG